MGKVGPARGLLQPLPPQPPDPVVPQADPRRCPWLLPRRTQPHGLLLRLHHRGGQRQVFGQAGPKVSSPADGFFVPYLTKVVGAKRAREMWMLCRRYPAEEALQMGLINKIVPHADLEQRGRPMVRRASVGEPRMSRDPQGQLRSRDGRVRRDGCHLQPVLPRLVRHARGQGGRRRVYQEAASPLLEPAPIGERKMRQKAHRKNTKRADD